MDIEWRFLGPNELIQLLAKPHGTSAYLKKNHSSNNQSCDELSWEFEIYDHVNEKGKKIYYNRDNP